MGHEIVGASGVILLGYTLLLIGIHMKLPHPSATKKIITLSYISLTLLTLAQAFIVGTYWMPHIAGSCICSGLWAAALISYVLGLYTLKFIYIERVEILNKHPMLASPKVSTWIKVLKYSLMASCLICVTMMIVLTGGECHSDPAVYGCKPTFHVADVYLAIAMIFVDAILFVGFCYKWWGLIKMFTLTKSSDNKIVVDMIKAFAVQCILTIVGMVSCVVDGVVNLWIPDYSTLIIFCCDSAVIASCNFAMIKESQAFMWKYLCWPCKIPSFVVKDRFKSKRNSRTGLKSVSDPTQTEKTEGTDTSKMETSASNNQNGSGQPPSQQAVITLPAIESVSPR